MILLYIFQDDRSYKTKPKEPTPAEISQSVPPSKATQNSDAALKQLMSFQLINSKNIEKERAMHKQLKQQMQKDGYLTKAAIISQTYQTRSDKGQHLLGY